MSKNDQDQRPRRGASGTPLPNPQRQNHVNDQEQRDRRTARLLALPSTGHSRDLRQRLRRARQELKMSHQDVADEVARLLGLESFSAGSISNYEQFTRHPPIDVMAAWARAVGMKLTVDLVDAASERVAVPLKPRPAWIARALDGAEDDDLDVIETLVKRLLPICAPDAEEP